ncbi:MAG: glycosyltransferase family 4 protein, partial [Waterburya sp.]
TAAGIPNVLHFHTIHPFLMGKSALSRWLKLFFFVGQLLVLKLMGTKIVWTVHEWKDKLGNDNNNISASQAQILGRFLNAIIAHCETTKQEIGTVFNLQGSDKLFVVPHGNYINCYPNKIDRSAARKKLDISSSAPVFLLFGDIYRYKGVMETIVAFKQLRHPATLLIAGLPQQENLQEEIEREIAHCQNVVFTPQRIADDEVQIYLNACDCVLVPYNVFTTSGIAILAMSFGRPCIAPNMGFFSDVFDDSRAFLYDSNLKDGLLSAMQQAISAEHKLAAMGNHNLDLAKQCNWQFVAAKTLDIYQKV